MKEGQVALTAEQKKCYYELRQAYQTYRNLDTCNQRPYWDATLLNALKNLHENGNPGIVFKVTHQDTYAKLVSPVLQKVRRVLDVKFALSDIMASSDQIMSVIFRHLIGRSHTISELVLCKPAIQMDLIDFAQLNHTRGSLVPGVKPPTSILQVLDLTVFLRESLCIDHRVQQASDGFQFLLDSSPNLRRIRLHAVWEHSLQRPGSLEIEQRLTNIVLETPRAKLQYADLRIRISSRQSLLAFMKRHHDSLQELRLYAKHMDFPVGQPENSEAQKLVLEAQTENLRLLIHPK